jgi:hypothetical protein
MLITRHRTGLCASALLGAIFLYQLAKRVEQNAIGPADGPFGIAKSEVLTIHATARLIDFARSHGSFDTNDDLVRSLRESNLEGTWCSLEIRDTMDDGGLQTWSRFIRPGEHDLMLSWSKSALDTLAGRPPNLPAFDFRNAEIFVIDESYMQRDPFDAVEELAELRRAGRSSHDRVQGRLGSRKSIAGLEF